MNSPSEWTITLATPAEGPELASVYDSDDGFGGDIAVRFSRGADPYASLLAEGDEVVVPIVREAATGRLLGMGACVLRDAWVDGRPRRVGYLTGLKAIPEARRRVPLIPQVYRFLTAHLPPDALLYTTILEENTLARRMLERRRPTMPEYRTVGTYVTHAIGRPPLRRPGARASEGTTAELLALSARDDLAPVTLPPALTDADVRLVRDRAGRPLAGCAVWDQRAHKHYVVTHYGGAYERASKLPTHWAGYPRFPRVGVPTAHASVTALAGAPEHIGPLLRAVASERRDLDFLLVGTMADHAYAGALASLRTVSYRSILYTVHPVHDTPGLSGRPVNLDVALL